MPNFLISFFKAVKLKLGFVFFSVTSDRDASIAIVVDFMVEDSFAVTSCVIIKSLGSNLIKGVCGCFNLIALRVEVCDLGMASVVVGKVVEKEVVVVVVADVVAVVEDGFVEALVVAVKGKRLKNDLKDCFNLNCLNVG